MIKFELHSWKMAKLKKITKKKYFNVVNWYLG